MITHKTTYLESESSTMVISNGVIKLISQGYQEELSERVITGLCVREGVLFGYWNGRMEGP